jgi:thioester reductase-like protein
VSGAYRDLTDLSPEEKRALLKQLLRAKAERKEVRASISPDDAVSVTDLSAEAVLETGIQPEAPPKATAEPVSVFLTGATGFLGAFLLSGLLRRTQADVHCLVRARDVQEGKERLTKALSFYSLWDEGLASRILPVPGNLSEPLFGFSEGRFQELADAVDVIYHCGASVNWVYPYERLKPTNVLGTREVLRLASRVRAKPVHFVSTLGVFPLVGNAGAKAVREEDPLDHGGALYNGYTQSKWVAEKLVEIARSRGLPASVYRPSLVTGSSRTGAWNTADFMCRVIKSWIELSLAPEVEATMNMVPVDYVGEAIVHLSLQEDSLGNNFHLANPRPVTPKEVAAWIRAFGYPLRKIPYSTWRAALTGPANGSFHSLAPLFSLGASEDAPEMVQTIPGFDCRNTLDGLSGTSIACPRVDGRTFEGYLSFFVRNGFLRRPGDV